MLKAVPPIYQKRDRRVKAKPAPPKPTVLTLVSATYVSATSVTLTFDRAIDLDGFDPLVVFVADGGANETFQGESYEAVGTDGVRVTLAEFDGGVPPGVRLSVYDANGIVALDGGPAWAGCDEVTLPFGG